MEGVRFFIKEFGAMTADELYAVLKLRSEVFVVEQDCVYLDLDGTDRRSVHVFAMEGQECVGCLRVFLRDGKTVQIGRVVTAHSRRGTGLGRALMEMTMAGLSGKPVQSDEMDTVPLEKMGERVVTAYLEAQTYAAGFYARFGFTVASDEFLEDGIPHVVMVNHDLHGCC